MTEATLTLLRSIETSANAAAAFGRIVTNTGPLRGFVDLASPLIWLNYAIPVRETATPEETLDAVGELRQTFREHGRTLRFEFIDLLWPDLPLLLERAGLIFQASQPMMTCDVHTFRPYAAPDVTATVHTMLSASSDLAAYLQIGREGFGDEPTASLEAIDREITALREGIGSGSMRCATAIVDGQAVGVGCIVSAAGVQTGNIGELAGVATLPAYRRRGVARTLSSVLTAEYLREGGRIVWLSAGDAAAEAAYARIGFTTIARRLNYIDPLLATTVGR